MDGEIVRQQKTMEEALAENPDASPCYLMGLPLELRTMIWRFVLPHRSNVSSRAVTPSGVIEARSMPFCWVRGNTGLLRVSKQLYDEAMPLLYRSETFMLWIQPRRAYLLFLHPCSETSPEEPAVGSTDFKHSSFGTIQTNEAIDFRTHRGFAIVNKWQLILDGHSIRSRRVRAKGLDSLFFSLTCELVYLDLFAHNKHTRSLTIQRRVATYLATLLQRHFNCPLQNIVMAGNWEQELCLMTKYL